MLEIKTTNYKGISIEVRRFKTYATVVVGDSWTKQVKTQEHLRRVLLRVREIIDVSKRFA